MQTTTPEINVAHKSKPATKVSRKSGAKKSKTSKMKPTQVQETQPEEPEEGTNMSYEMDEETPEMAHYDRVPEEETNMEPEDNSTAHEHAEAEEPTMETEHYETPTTVAPTVSPSVSAILDAVQHLSPDDFRTLTDQIKEYTERDYRIKMRAIIVKNGIREGDEITWTGEDGRIYAGTVAVLPPETYRIPVNPNTVDGYRLRVEKTRSTRSILPTQVRSITRPFLPGVP